MVSVVPCDTSNTGSNGHKSDEMAEGTMKRGENGGAREEDISISYSFGGTKHSPLVSRKVTFRADPAVHQTMEEACVERRDAMLDDLCEVFDAAEQTYDASETSRAERLKQLDIMTGAVLYTVKAVLVLAPDARYGLMYDRIQRVLRRLEQIEKDFGKRVRDCIVLNLHPAWQDLQLIDATFRRNE